MAKNPSPDPGGFRLAPISPLLADPEWIAGFKQAIQGFLDVARTLSRNHKLPNYPLWLEARRLSLAYVVLSNHLQRVIAHNQELGDKYGIVTYAGGSEIPHAYQWACGIVQDSRLNVIPPEPGQPLPPFDPALIPTRAELDSLQTILDMISSCDSQASLTAEEKQVEANQLEAPALAGDDRERPIAPAAESLIANPVGRLKGDTVRAERPGGGRIPVDLASWTEFPLPCEAHQRRLLYCDPEATVWVYREQNWTVRWRRLDALGTGANHPDRSWADAICRIVNREEAAAMFREAGLAIPPELAELKNTERPALRPCWDRDNRRLWYGKTLCRDFSKRMAPTQMRIVEVFDKAEWKKPIQAPFTDKTLRDNIRSLNKGLEPDSPIEFAPSGPAQMIWRFR